MVFCWLEGQTQVFSIQQSKRRVSKQRPMIKEMERTMVADMKKHASFRKGTHACNDCPGDPQICDNCGERCVIADKRRKYQTKMKLRVWIMKQNNLSESLLAEMQMSSTDKCVTTGLQRRRRHGGQRSDGTLFVCDPPHPPLWTALRWRREPVREAGGVKGGFGWFFDVDSNQLWSCPTSWRQRGDRLGARPLRPLRGDWGCDGAKARLCIWEGQSRTALPSSRTHTRKSVHLFPGAVILH